jgi:hypothetical protein
MGDDGCDMGVSTDVLCRFIYIGEEVYIASCWRMDGQNSASKQHGTWFRILRLGRGKEMDDDDVGHWTTTTLQTRS